MLRRQISAIARHAGISHLTLVMMSVLLLGMLPMTGLLWVVADAGRRDAEREAGFRLTHVAGFAARLQTGALATVAHALESLAAQPADWAVDKQSCASHAEDMTARHPYISGMAVVLRDGMVHCTSNGRGSGVNLLDRPYMQQALAQPGLAVGTPVRTRISDTPALPTAVRIALPPLGDNPPTWLAVTLDLAQIAGYVTPNMIGGSDDADGRVKIFDADGRLLMGYPTQGGAPAIPALDPRLLAEQRGSFDIVGTDGEVRLIALARAAEGGITYGVTIRKAHLMAAAEARFRQVFALGILAGLLGLVAALLIARSLILRPLSLLTDATRTEGAAMPSDTLPGEFETLRRAMSSMMADVASREQRLQRANQELAFLADRDALTGLANRRRFDADFSEAWSRSLASQDSLALIILDVDNFKKFNDRYGHLAGDACLCKVARAIAGLPLRDHDLPARMGGEEFVILLPRTDSAGALVVAERALAAIRDRGVLHEDGVEGIVTASAGVASCTPIRGMDRQALVAAADAALYAAKHAGRDRAMTARSAAETGIAQTA
jgi:diguanylate cyclase (GGDEF)-like protein